MVVYAYANQSLSLAFFHSQVFISFAKLSNRQLKSALNTFCAQGGNILWSERTFEGHGTDLASTILSLISRHGAAFNFLEHQIFSQSEPWTMEDLSTMDRWLIGVLASVSHTFRASLDSYLRSYRCVFTPGRNDYSPLDAFDLAIIVSEVMHAPNKARIEFLKILVKWGTKEMLQPFFDTGLIDLEESAANDMFPWLRLSYLSKAVRWGNNETFEYLLSIGACPIRGLTYLSRFPNAHPQGTENSQNEISAMIVKMAEHVNGLVDSEARIDHNLLLALLLRTSSLRTHSQLVTDQLIDQFIIQSYSQIVGSSQGISATYLLIALVLNLPNTLKYFLHQKDTLESHFNSSGDSTSISYDFSPFDSISPTFDERSVFLKCYPPLNSFSWVSLAVELGLPECLQVLLDSWMPLDADWSTTMTSARSKTLVTEQYTRSMNTLNDLISGIKAGRQQQKDPRAAVKLYTWPCQIPQQYVEQQQEEQNLLILKNTTQELWDHLNFDSSVRVGRVYDHRLTSDIVAAKRAPTSQRAKRTKQLVTRLLATTAQLLRLRAWEIGVLCFSYIITLIVFLCYSS